MWANLVLLADRFAHRYRTALRQYCEFHSGHSVKPARLVLRLITAMAQRDYQRTTGLEDLGEYAERTLAPTRRNVLPNGAEQDKIKPVADRT